MNKQSEFNANDFLNIVGPSGQIFYLEIESNLPELPVESRAVPLNFIVNSTQDRFLVPAVNGKTEENQVCVYIEPVSEDISLQSFDKDKKYNTVNQNDNIGDSIDPKASSSNSVTIDSSLDISTKIGDDNDTNKGKEYASRLKTASKSSKSKIVKNKIKGFVPVLDRVVPPRAFAVLPPVLHLRRDFISPRRCLPERVRFGPVQGITRKISSTAAYDLAVTAAKSKCPLFLLHHYDSVTHIDVSDKDKSNWLGLLPLGTQSTANVWLYEEDGNLYGITVQSLEARTPLALGYSKPYAQAHNLPDGQPVLDINEDLFEEPRRWWCYECIRSFLTSALLQRHVDQYHSEAMKTRRKYNCKYCTRSFIRLFTLKRHMASHCTKKSIIEKSSKPTNQEEALNTSLNIEDNRLPSDESLQNYTNVLDFSTNLFDTDRMPGLDISGNSRSETDFNPYGISYRDDHELSHDLGFDKITAELDKSQDSKKSKKTTEAHIETMLVTCQYCKQTILREQKRQHLSECAIKRFQCECGCKFSSNKKFAQHVHVEHSKNTPIEVKKESEATNDLEYKCETCNLSFKRRGMLVNHLWRAHQSRAVVPLERRERHYPCSVCPKLYRTASKRDFHHRAHHPGVPISGRYSIEGGRRSVTPASCSVCPRQYATRAKLLQHQRQCHPELAPPLEKTSKKSNTSTTHQVQTWK